MTAVSTTPAAGDLALGADPTAGFRRRAGAIALPLAFLCQAACNTIYAWATRDGGGDTGEAADTLAFYAEHGAAMRVATVLALVGCFLAIPGLLAALRVLRTSRPRLALSAVLLMIAGYVCYFGIVFTNFDTIALAAGGVDAAAALDVAGADPVTVPFFLLFVAGNLGGTLLLALAVMLSRSLPWYAGALILGWPVGHVLNLIVTNEWYAVAGGLLEVAGLTIVALAALRLTNRDWARRG